MSGPTESDSSLQRDTGWLFAATAILVGAFLLFQVEPLIAKAILPWFGGSAQVWTTCLLFFQTALLAGYLYAHLLTEHVRRIWQIRVHVALLLTSLWFLPIHPSERWKPLGSEDPLPLIIGLLTMTIGLPFVLLSATSPLVQAWLARTKRVDAGQQIKGTAQSNTYRFFALSNFGSMIALLSYPVLVEPNFAIKAQALVWSSGYGVFALIAAATAWQHRFGEGTVIRARGLAVDAPSWADRSLWFWLATIPSALLLAITNYMLQNIAPIPLLWVVPLALYLLTFIFAFGNLRWFSRPIWYQLFMCAVASLAVAMSGLLTLSNFGFLLLFNGALFIICMVCHGELASLRPQPRNLTAYYLTISAGGAVGGLFVAGIAPAVFNGNYELPVLITLAVLLVIAAASRNYRSWADHSRGYTLGMSAAIMLCATTLFMARATYLEISGNLLLARNFYGALRVEDIAGASRDTEMRRLLNGNVDHGREYVAPNKRREPLTYYSRLSGIGILLAELEKDGPLHVGVIGLGAGTIASYGRAGDIYRFYEINPLVQTIAEHEFWYLSLCQAKWGVVLGDARLSLEGDPPQEFDVLAVDAFTSDAVPVHLLTREAFALYWRHVKPDGIIAVHVSNKYVDLAPIVAVAAAESGKSARIVVNDANPSRDILASTWVLVTSRPGFFDRSAFRETQTITIPPGLRAWTDDYSNLWRAFRFEFLNLSIEWP